MTTKESFDELHKKLYNTFLFPIEEKLNKILRIISKLLRLK